MQVASSAASFYKKLSEWFMKLGTLCPRLSEWQSLFPNSVALQKSLDAFYATVIRLFMRAVLVLDRTGRRTAIRPSEGFDANATESSPAGIRAAPFALA